MFNTLTNLISNAGEPIKLFIAGVLALLAFIFAVKPFVNLMKDVGDKKWGGAIAWLAAVIAIFAIPTLFIAIAFFGQKVGTDVSTVFQ